MARKLRVEYEGAIYHVMNRGERRPKTGNLLYQTNFNGMVTTNQYDFASGRLTNVSSAGYQPCLRSATALAGRPPERAHVTQFGS